MEKSTPIQDTTEEKEHFGDIRVKQQNIISGAIKPRHLAATEESVNGDLYYSGGDNQFYRLPPGTDGQYLQTNGEGAAPEWSTVNTTPASNSITTAMLQTGSVTGAKLGTAIAARVYQNADQSTSNNTTTYLTFGSERFDTASIHSTVSNQTRLTVPQAGIYLIGGNVQWADNSTGRRILSIRLNGTTSIADTRGIANYGGFGDLALTVSTLYALSANDYVELGAFQDSGGSLNVTSGANFSPEFWIIMMGTT